MKKSYALAAWAALAVTLAACGDDDDDASNDTTAITDAAGDETPSADTGDTGDDPIVTASSPASVTGEDADALADCEALNEVVVNEVQPPAIDEEIDDEYREFINSTIDDLEGLDMRTDAGEESRDALVDLLNNVADADTMTQELQDFDLPDEVDAFSERCGELLGASG